MPTKNLPSIPSKPPTDLWPILENCAGIFVNRYVVVYETCQQIITKHPKTSAAQSQRMVERNPHAARVASEHCYSSPTSQTSSRRKRRLPQWLRSHEQTPAISTALIQIDYSSAVLNDELLLLEQHDAICEGDGVRVLRCWKFMLLYWRPGGVGQDHV